ncbi:MAG: DUF2807 domain-containing protein [Sphingobacteriaceae bacterium]|nr:DUF2807 domain-containing protein [Sphingobacteriaceae bacterium]
MKKFNTISALIFVFIVSISFTSYASPIKKSVINFTSLSNLKNFTKLKVSGNVLVYLVQSETESVNIQDNYYSKNAFIQQQNNELKITSFEKQPLTVYVYVKNLSEISASDNVVIKTLDTFNLLSLDLVLNNNAKAFITSNTITFYSQLADNSSLVLNGSCAEHYSTKNVQSKLNTNQFLADITFSNRLTETKKTFISQANNTLESIDLNNL